MSACFKSVQRKTFIFRVLSIGVLSFKNKVHIGFAPVIINSSKELQRQLFKNFFISNFNSQLYFAVKKFKAYCDDISVFILNNYE